MADELISAEDLEEAHWRFMRVVFGIAKRGNQPVGEGLLAGEKLFQDLGIDPAYIKEMSNALPSEQASGFLHGFSFAVWFMKERGNG